MNLGRINKMMPFIVKGGLEAKALLTKAGAYILTKSGKRIKTK